jgi:membrane fusion protein (multidrug efflux system)
METNQQKGSDKQNTNPTNVPDGQSKPSSDLNESSDVAKSNSPIKKILPLLGIIVLIVVGVVVFKYWQYASTHASTDDAYLTSDVIQISPQVTGTVTKVYVEDNQVVKAGDLLVTLDDSTYRTAYDQAKANLDAAIAQARGAGTSVKLTAETGMAQIQQATGGLNQTQGGILAADADSARARAAILTAQANASAANAAIETAVAGVNSAVANELRSKDGITAAIAQMHTAEAAVKTAKANMAALQAQADRAKRDAERYSGLRKQGAVSEQTADQANAASLTAQAQVEAAAEQVAQAQSQVIASQANVSAAKQQADAAKAAIAQAKSALTVAKQQADAAQADVAQARAAHKSAVQNVYIARARQQQAAGVLQQAHTTPHQVSVSKSNKNQVMAKIEQMRAALEYARIQLNYTRIYAPVSGRVSKKTVEQGELLQPGTPMMALVPTNDIWVVANYKETQMKGLRTGNYAEVEVDAVPGIVYKGHVNSIAAATGATFALLPPDNATGNFTKIVQRIPVKIVLDPDQPDIERLRAGMSVNAYVNLRK